MPGKRNRQKGTAFKKRTPGRSTRWQSRLNQQFAYETGRSAWHQAVRLDDLLFANLCATVTMRQQQFGRKKSCKILLIE